MKIDLYNIKTGENMKTKTEPKYRVIKHFPSAHIYYREQYTNRIAVGDQSCIDRENNILPPTMQDDAAHGVLYIDFGSINEWNLQSKKDSLHNKSTYGLPLINDAGDTFFTPITESEYKWLVGYF
jgi:hypothetical protein